MLHPILCIASHAGAPNRDTASGSIANSDLIDVNSGSAIIFDLSFLSLQFDAPAYSVTEGSSVTVGVSRSMADAAGVTFFSLRSLDRSVDSEFTAYVASVFDVPLNPPDVGMYETLMDVVGAGTATASIQAYGATQGTYTHIDYVCAILVIVHSAVSSYSTVM